MRFLHRIFLRNCDLAPFICDDASRHFAFFSFRISKRPPTASVSTVENNSRLSSSSFPSSSSTSSTTSSACTKLSFISNNHRIRFLLNRQLATFHQCRSTTTTFPDFSNLRSCVSESDVSRSSLRQIHSPDWSPRLFLIRPYASENKLSRRIFHSSDWSLSFFLDRPRVSVGHLSWSNRIQFHSSDWSPSFFLVRPRVSVGLSRPSRRQFHSSASTETKRRQRKGTVYIHKTPVAEVWPGIMGRELARAIDLEPEEILEAARISDPEDRIYDTILLQEIVKESAFRCRLVQRYDVPAQEVEDKSELDAYPRPPPTEAEREKMPPRHPVVTIMGHVDHGKTTLLDRLRKSNVVSQEFGGITQHIGAFSVLLPSSGSRITFLDTPGHAAFSAMRGRGANVTDIVILVVAAEDGAMNQTEESIQHAEAAGVPIVVAINKIDRPEADVELTKRSLMQCGLTLEEVGGDVMCVPISALLGTNVDQLMEAVLTQAELLDLKADATGEVEARVIETRQVEGRGKLATILVERGTLKVGAFLVAGDEAAECKVKAMNNAEGKALKEVKPADPVEVMGWKDLPNPGDKVLQVANQRRLRQVVSYRKEEIEKRKFLEAQKIVEKQKIIDRENYEAHFAARVESGRRRLRIPDFRREKEDKSPVDLSHPFLNVILRGDVDGSLEAILNVFDTYDDKRCKLDVVNFGVGPPGPSDLELADTFKCIIYCFNIKVPASIESLAREKQVELHHFNIIYRLFEHMKAEMTFRLPPLFVDQVIGIANVMQPFNITDEQKKKRPVAGSQCVRGELLHDGQFKLLRGGSAAANSAVSLGVQTKQENDAAAESEENEEAPEFNGPLYALKHFKDDVKTISQGMDCGIALDSLEVEPKAGDKILCYKLKEVKQQITWDLDF